MLHIFRRSCPNCRQKSYFIVPSQVWIPDTAHKKKYIDEYKKDLKRKPCKYQRHNGECPFAHNCFYNHEIAVDGQVIMTAIFTAVIVYVIKTIKNIVRSALIAYIPKLVSRELCAATSLRYFYFKFYFRVFRKLSLDFRIT